MSDRRVYPEAARWIGLNGLGSFLLFVALVALVVSTGCVNPEAVRNLSLVAAADEGDMLDASLSDDARRVAMENAYAIHQALWLLDSDYERPAWVVEFAESFRAE